MSASAWLTNTVAPLTGSVDRNGGCRNGPPAGGSSLPSRGAWIEIPLPGRFQRRNGVAPLTGSVDRNQWLTWARSALAPSLPSRGAWIEIVDLLHAAVRIHESLLSRGAWIEITLMPGAVGGWLVAPLAGSVDRNSGVGVFLEHPDVAPLAGSVDRNMSSGWVAWGNYVAPLAGSVDRNLVGLDSGNFPARSLPSRGAWIEI